MNTGFTVKQNKTLNKIFLHYAEMSSVKRVTFDEADGTARIMTFSEFSRFVQMFDLLPKGLNLFSFYKKNKGKSCFNF